jgi:hypothetical protein
MTQIISIRRVGRMSLAVTLAKTAPKELGRLVGEGNLTAEVAIEAALAAGHLLVGTVEGRPRYIPSKAMNHASGVWRPVALAESGSAIDVVRANRVARAAIICATFGDCNETGQRTRLGRPLVESDERLLFGWRHDREAEDEYRAVVDGRLFAAVLNDPEAVLGAVDIFADDGSWVELTNECARLGNGPEPNHYISRNTQSTIGSIPITGEVFLSLPNIELTSPMR